MAVDKNWLLTATPAEVEEIFLDAMSGEKDVHAILGAASEVIEGLQYEAEYLIALERALVLEVGRVGAENNVDILLGEIETVFAMLDAEDIYTGSTLGTALGYLKERIAHNDQTDPQSLQRWEGYLKRIKGFIGWILFAMERDPEKCKTSQPYYQKCEEICRQLLEMLIHQRILAAEVPGMPRVVPQTLKSLHEDSILDLYAVLKQGEQEAKTIRRLQVAAALENKWYSDPDIDLCDKWLLLGEEVGARESLLEAKKYQFDMKHHKAEKVDVTNALKTEALKAERDMRLLLANAGESNALKERPSRFWRAVLALLLCGVMMYLGWHVPERFEAGFENGFGMLFALGGYAFLAGLAGGSFLYGLLLFFVSMVAMGYVTFAWITDGRIPVQTGITFTIFCGMGICMLFLLKRIWSSRHTLRDSGRKRKEIREQLEALEQRAALGAGCTALLLENAKRQKMQDVAERYQKLNMIFSEASSTVRRQLGLK